MAIELSEKQIKNGWQIVKFVEIAKEVKSTTKDGRFSRTKVEVTG